ncbi:MAG: DNA internalization-related competence protein ComEC/Rec2 [Pseudomonadota bacterium]
MPRFVATGICALLLAAVSVLRCTPSAYPAALSAHELTITARVTVRSVPRVSEFGQQMVMRVHDPVSARQVQVFWPAGNRVQRNDDSLCWQLTLRLTALHRAGNPGLPDRAGRLRARRIDGLAQVVDHADNRPCGRQPRVSSVRLRARLGAQIRAAVADSATSAVLVALATGDRQYLTPALRERFARTGTAHIMAISGMHIGLVAGCCFFIVRWIFSGRRPYVDAWALVCSVLAGSCYAGLAGGAVPTLRAVAMLSLAAVFWLRRIRLDLVRLTLLVAGAFLLADPVMITSPAFIMSFAAVAALGLAQRRGRAVHANMQPGRLRAIRAQTLLSVALMPLVATLFGEVSIISLVVNVLVLPVFAFAVIPTLLTGIVVAPLALSLAENLWRLSGLLCGMLLEGMAIVVRHVPGWVATTGLGAFEASLAAGMLLAGVLLAGWPGRALWLLAAPIALLARAQPESAGCVSAHMLNVGHGTAIVLAGERRRWLYDTGPSWRGGGSAAQTIVIPYLQRHWGGSFARAVVSHSDNDHDGGVGELRRLARAQAWLGVPGAVCVAGQRWQFEGVRFEVLWPLPAALSGQHSDNNASCVVRVSTHNQALLLLGDVERQAERELVSLGGLAANVSTMPHHGSNSSSTPALVAAITPAHVIASAGRRRGWQLPHAGVEQRWRDANARVHVTARHGAIQVRLCRGATQVVTDVASL